MNKKITASCLSLALALGLFSTTALAAEEPSQPVDTGEGVVQSQEVTEPTPAAEENETVAIINDYTLTSEITGGNFVVEESATITVSGNVTLTGDGDAFTINADTVLVFENGATLTLDGYTNGFVVSGASLTSEDMQITASTEMDVFRLKAKAKLYLSGENSIQGCGKTGTANRAIVLESTPVDEGQTVTLAANSTLHANNFYRGMETGSAKDYTISGAGMESSVFDFSNNDCGIALSYFDRDANFANCTLEVSNCINSGIYMRQDNASLYGLYFNYVNINCVNDTRTEDIAIRFHTGPFEFNNSKMTIVNSSTTGLWIYDGWNADQGGSKITDSEISISDVTGGGIGILQRPGGKGITFAICHDWEISGSTITFNDCGYAGINLSNDTQVDSTSNPTKATARMVGGKLIVSNSVISASDMDISGNAGASAVFTVQIGQFLELTDDVLVYDENGAEEPLVICARNDDPYLYWKWSILPTEVSFDTSNLSEELQTDDRYIVTGGNIPELYDDDDVYKVEDRNVPINNAGDKLTLYALTAEQYDEYVSSGTVTLTGSDGVEYSYHISKAAPDGKYYIWAPFGSFSDDVQVIK